MFLLHFLVLVRIFILHDRSGTYEEKEFKIDLEIYPSPDELWSRYKKSMSISDEDEMIYLKFISKFAQ